MQPVLCQVGYGQLWLEQSLAEKIHIILTADDCMLRGIARVNPRYASRVNRRLGDAGTKTDRTQRCRKIVSLAVYRVLRDTGSVGGIKGRWGVHCREGAGTGHRAG